jgi:hypothetical protein
VGEEDPKITEVLPLLYLHGLSSRDFVPALGQFLGSSAGLSATVITRLPVGRWDPREHPAGGVTGDVMVAVLGGLISAGSWDQLPLWASWWSGVGSRS